MADHITSKLNPDSHLILDQPLLRLPFELLRKNFKVAHLNVEKESTALKSTLRETANASLNANASPDDVLKNVDSMIARMRGLKRKLTSCSEEENRLHQQSQSRIRHLGELYGMQSLDDVKYEEWSRTRLDRLLVDYLLRYGYKESASELAQEKGIGELVDVETFVQMSRVSESLRRGRVTEALAWCNENKKDLRRMESKLEFTLRFQQYIEMIRTQDEQKLLNAITHAKKYLLPFKDSFPGEIQQVYGLLAFPPGVGPDPYARQSLVRSFKPFHAYTQLPTLSPPVPLLHIALSAGLSALKTPSCHSLHAPSSTTSICPICSTELNDLARPLPYAHHTKSHVESDLKLLPNGCAYGKRKLEEYARKAGLDAGWYKDLRSGEVYRCEEATTVYIS
ncbi:Protein FYV10 [Lachnellula cervina]|uniref:Protein FYV10 n=1 Tax=Lachnellula cervina TaxID=1316786 RepID=A0A7D8UKR0_9HELO|nr:Protein FYV10 [Lachnellula cervina]